MTCTGPALPQSSFSTDAVAPEHRFAAWRTALASSHAVEASPNGFFGRVRSVQAGSLLVHELDSAPVALDRSAAQVRRDGLDHLVLHLSRHRIQAEAAGHELEVPPHRFSINDLSRPTTRRHVPETGSLVAILPRSLMREALGDCDMLHGRTLESGAGALLAAHLRHIVENAGTISVTAGPALARATAHLVAACVNPTLHAVAEAAPAIEGAKLARARAFIEANLARPDLTPDLIGRAVGLSRSALFRAFEPLGGVSAYLWSRRLSAVRLALRDATDARPIAELGYAHGFTSSAHLSRAFRREFGQSPREWRRSGEPWDGQAIGPHSPRAT